MLELRTHSAQLLQSYQYRKSIIISLITASQNKTNYLTEYIYDSTNLSVNETVKLERLPEYLRDTVDWFMG
ncbi:hypothetical protein KGM_215966A, partial [Danaus plexippus plexippus]